MTVKELIEILSSFPQDMEVVIVDGDGCNSAVPEPRFKALDINGDLALRPEAAVAEVVVL